MDAGEGLTPARTVGTSTEAATAVTWPDSAGYALVVVAGVLGAVALLLSVIYAYIYCAKIKPRHRHTASDRINYFERDLCLQYGGQADKEQPERAPIKAHPFFVISSASRNKTSTGEGTQFASTSTKGY